MIETQPGDTLGTILGRVGAKYPKQEAMVCGSERVTYDTLLDRVNSIVSAMLKMGIKKGDKVAIWMSNIPQWVYVHFACVKIGAPVIPINTRYKVHELEYILKQSDSTTLFMMDKFLKIDFTPMIYEVCPELKTAQPGDLNSKALPLLKRVIVVNEQSYPGMIDYKDVVESGKDYATSPDLDKALKSVQPEDTYLIPFTSGTTGFPKGVVTTHDQYVRVIIGFSKRFQMTENDRILVVSPFYHNMGNMAGMTLGACHGTCILPMESFDPGEGLRLIDEEKASNFSGSPTMYIMMLDHADFPKRDTTSIKSCIIGGADVSPDLVRTIQEKMGIKDVISAYGMTENSGISTCSQPGDPIDLIANTAGKLMFDDCELKIVDPDTGADVPPDTQGEIRTRGWYVMKEYYKQPEETAKAFDENGWFHTGDLGTMDKNGYIKITGRLKDMFITGGVNAYPAEIESFLMTHPKISMVAVTGVPDRRMGEVAMAFVKLKEGQTSTEEEIITFAREKMANYKAPKYVKFVDDFPMTATGKIQKFILKDIAVEELGLDKQ
ncbi:MAG: AMP-binding protein [Dehalococcoidia bacterium]|nr:MAG: AMP-binding protein [Dehalococcoidia bacterium]